MERHQSVDNLLPHLSTEPMTTTAAAVVSPAALTWLSSSPPQLPPGLSRVPLYDHRSIDFAAPQRPPTQQGQQGSMSSHPINLTDIRTFYSLREIHLQQGNSDSETGIHSLNGTLATESTDLVAPLNLGHEGAEILVQWPPATVTPASTHPPIDFSVSLLSGEHPSRRSSSSSPSCSRFSMSTLRPPSHPPRRIGYRPTVSQTKGAEGSSSGAIWRVKKPHELSPSALNSTVSIQDRISSIPELESKRWITSPEEPSVHPSTSLPFLNTSSIVVKAGSSDVGAHIGSNSRRGNGSAPRRPINSFMLYKKKTIQDNRALFKFLNMSGAQISSHVAHSWRKEPEQVKLQYETLADIEKLAFLNAFPNYRYRQSISSMTTTPAPASLPSSTSSGVPKVSGSAARAAVGPLLSLSSLSSSSSLRRVGGGRKKKSVTSSTIVGEEEGTNGYAQMNVEAAPVAILAVVPETPIRQEATSHPTEDQSSMDFQRNKREEHLKGSGYIKALAIAQGNDDTDSQDSAV